jgi:hypothetical protein
MNDPRPSRNPSPSTITDESLHTMTVADATDGGGKGSALQKNYAVVSNNIVIATEEEAEGKDADAACTGGGLTARKVIAIVSPEPKQNSSVTIGDDDDDDINNRKEQKFRRVSWGPDLVDAVNISFDSADGQKKVLLADIIEAAMSSNNFDTESCLGKLLLRCDDANTDRSAAGFADDDQEDEEEEGGGGAPTTEDALTAAVTDLMNLQTTLHSTERELVQMKSQPTNEAVWQGRVNDLEIQLAAAQKLAGQSNTAKERILANLRQKKAALVATEGRLAAAERDLSALTSENTDLRATLESVAASRDTLKTRLRSQQGTSKESRNTIQELEKRVRRLERARAVEGELLDNFRKLAIHTG